MFPSWDQSFEKFQMITRRHVCAVSTAYIGVYTYVCVHTVYRYICTFLYLRAADPSVPSTAPSRSSADPGCLRWLLIKHPARSNPRVDLAVDVPILVPQPLPCATHPLLVPTARSPRLHPHATFGNPSLPPRARSKQRSPRLINRFRDEEEEEEEVEEEEEEEEEEEGEEKDEEEEEEEDDGEEEEGEEEEKKDETGSIVPDGGYRTRGCTRSRTSSRRIADAWFSNEAEWKGTPVSCTLVVKLIHLETKDSSERWLDAYLNTSLHSNC